MDKQPVGTLPDLTASSLDDEIMIITDSEHNQLKKEKISDFITDLTSTDENNALTKGTDGKMFVTDFGNASNITEGTLPVSVLPDIPKDKLPDIEITDLPESGVTADTYAYPSSVTVNAQGMVTAISEGTPSGVNANTDLSNITEAGKEVIRQNANPIGRPIFCLNGESLNSNEIWLEGAEVSKAAYAELYAVYGDTYGEASSPDNFVLPDFRNRSIWGSSDATFGYQSAALPNITGQIDTTIWGGSAGRGIFTNSSGSFQLHGNSLPALTVNGSQESARTSFLLDANRSSIIYQDGITTVVPSSIKIRVKTRYK